MSDDRSSDDDAERQQSERDIARVDCLLNALKLPVSFSSMRDQIRGEIRAAASDFLDGDAPGGVARLKQLDEALAVEADGDDPTAARSIWSRESRSLGQLRFPDGRLIDVDELEAWRQWENFFQAWKRTTDRATLVQIRTMMRALIDLMIPPERGPRPADVLRRPPVDLARLAEMYEELHALITARTAPLPDAWGASEPADDGTAFGFDGMPPSEVAYRLLAWKLGYARDTGWRRVQELVTEARRPLE